MDAAAAADPMALESGIASLQCVCPVANSNFDVRAHENLGVHGSVADAVNGLTAHAPVADTGDAGTHAAARAGVGMAGDTAGGTCCQGQ